MKKPSPMDVATCALLVLSVTLAFGQRGGIAANINKRLADHHRAKLLHESWGEIASASVVVKGPEKATPQIVEFADYECPYCRSAQAVIDSFSKTHPDVAIGFMHFPLPQHARAEPVAIASVCLQKSEILRSAHADLFDVANSASVSDVADSVLALGNRLGWTKAQSSAVAQCIQFDSSVRQAIEVDKFWAQKLGVESTPTFVGRGELLSGVPTIEKLQHLVDSDH